MKLSKAGGKVYTEKFVIDIPNGLYEDEENDIILVAGFGKLKMAIMLRNLEATWKADEQITLRPFTDTESVTLIGN